MFPDARGHASMVHYMTVNAGKDTQRTRDEIPPTTSQNFRKFADVMDGVVKNGLVKVLGSENAIAETADGKLPPLNRLKVL